MACVIWLLLVAREECGNYTFRLQHSIRPLYTRLASHPYTNSPESGRKRGAGGFVCIRDVLGAQSMVALAILACLLWLLVAASAAGSACLAWCSQTLNAFTTQNVHKCCLAVAGAAGLLCVLCLCWVLMYVRWSLPMACVLSRWLRFAS